MKIEERTVRLIGSLAVHRNRRAAGSDVHQEVINSLLEARQTGWKRTRTIGLNINIIWACTLGIALFLAHLFAGILSCIFIITIPFGLHSFKLAGLSFWPVGRQVVGVELARAVRKDNAKIKLAKMYRVPVSSNEKPEFSLS
ncbi:YccF domain-containing protein [Rhizobium leguminosarum]|uniref:YccF domain-containing protein n=1 Tax=Rhizobium leguminosarum TaxID=384 RepID=UPI0028AC6338|nr:YccF domain-containing protein [Rhizobium leguminosarum]